METTKAAITSISTRPFLAVIVLATAAAAAATAVAFKYQATALNQNDIEQRTRKAPYGYVSVDRSGGGI
ncbi:hypothetical protein ACHAPT_005047 [Fusarium lateritium]